MARLAGDGEKIVRDMGGIVARGKEGHNSFKLETWSLNTTYTAGADTFESEVLVIPAESQILDIITAGTWNTPLNNNFKIEHRHLKSPTNGAWVTLDAIAASTEPSPNRKQSIFFTPLKYPKEFRIELGTNIVAAAGDTMRFIIIYGNI